MKILSIICLVALVSCTTRGPASLNGHPVAYDSVALGNVQANAVKRMDKQDVCFDINLHMTGAKQQEILPSNWTVAWVDQQDHFHLLSANQRDPASAPQGGQQIAPYGVYQEWKNQFTTCAPKANFQDVKTLVLTPKEMPFPGNNQIHLTWQ